MLWQSRRSRMKSCWKLFVPLPVSLSPWTDMAKDLIISLLDGETHDRTMFDCGEPVLNAYLQKTARQHLQKGIANTCVLVDAMRRVAVTARTAAGVVGLFVGAKNPGVAAFYRKFGFIPLEDNPLSLMIPCQTLMAALPEGK